MTQERIQKKPQARDSKGRFTSTAHAEVPAERSPEEQAKIDALDDLLDEIDAVLEENAQEFVAQYIQKGGE